MWQQEKCPAPSTSGSLFEALLYPCIYKILRTSPVAPSSLELKSKRGYNWYKSLLKAAKIRQKSPYIRISLASDQREAIEAPSPRTLLYSTIPYLTLSFCQTQSPPRYCVYSFYIVLDRIEQIQSDILISDDLSLFAFRLVSQFQFITG